MSETINAEKRLNYGKNASRLLRREGKIPAILYGSNIETQALILNKKDIFNIFKSETSENTLFKISVDSDIRDVMIKEFQKDVVSDQVLHVDLIQIEMDKSIRVAIPIVLVGEAVGVKTEGGFVDFASREIEIECLPTDIPDQVEADISNLHINQSLKLSEIPEIEGVKLISDPQTIIALVLAPAAEEVIEEVVEEEEVIPGEEEPEIIKKDKAEEEASSPEKKKE